MIQNADKVCTKTFHLRCGDVGHNLRQLGLCMWDWPNCSLVVLPSATITKEKSNVYCWSTSTKSDATVTVFGFDAYEPSQWGCDTFGLTWSLTNGLWTKCQRVPAIMSPSCRGDKHCVLRHSQPGERRSMKRYQDIMRPRYHPGNTERTSRRRAKNKKCHPI